MNNLFRPNNLIMHISPNKLAVILTYDLKSIVIQYVT